MFFVYSGVLDPEELSCIIEGAEKEEKHVLAAIQEDVHNSCESSFSTLESDNLTLDSLEADLFEDIRASIQKSSKKSNVANSNNKVPSGIAGFLTVDCRSLFALIYRSVVIMCTTSFLFSPSTSFMLNHLNT